MADFRNTQSLSNTESTGKKALPKDQGYPNSVLDADRRRVKEAQKARDKAREELNLYQMYHPTDKEGIAQRSKALSEAENNYWIATGHANREEGPAETQKSSTPKDSTKKDSKPQDQNQNQSQSQNKDKDQAQDQINRNWYTDYYGRDIHKNGATPFQGKKKDEDETPENDPNSTNKQKVGMPFFNDAVRAIHGYPTGNQHDVRANTYRNQAVNSENEAARADMEKQWHEQNKNQNKWGESGKARTQQNYDEGKEQVQKSGVLGGSAALQRGNAKSDINYWDERQRSEALQAQERGDAAGEARDAAIWRRGSGDEQNIMSRDMREWNNEAYRLVQGNGGADNNNTSVPQDNPPPAEQPQQPAEQPQQPEAQPITGNPHHVFNYITFGNKPGSPNQNMQGMDENDRKLWEAWGSPKPLTAEEVQNVPGGFNGDLGQLQQVVRQVRPEFYNKYNEASGRNLDTANQNNSMTQNQLNGMSTSVPAYAKGTDNAKPGMALVGENGPELVMMQGGEKVLPNDDTEKLVNGILGLRMDMFKRGFENGEKFSPAELAWLSHMAGKKFNYNGNEVDVSEFEDKDDYDEGLMKAYAEHMRNYVYNYKPEAQSIDPSIDPNEEHIGPMAQDIEQINPACVKETPEGVKTVDTNRLTMMNAGVIGDIIRKLDDISDRLSAMEARNVR